MWVLDQMLDRKAGVPPVRALERGLAILSAFTPDRPRMNLTDIANEAALDKNTARRLLQTLVASGFVFSDRSRGQYGLTARLMTMASAVQVGGELRAAGEDVLRQVAAQTGATSFLWVHDGGQALCVARVRVALANVDAVWFSVGGRTSLNSGAGPRVLLAFIPEADRQVALSLPMERRTPRAEVDTEMLRAQAHANRARGWDYAADDFVIGLAGLGVPIVGSSGKLLGALSVSTTIEAYGTDAPPANLSVLLAAAADIAARMERSD